MDAETRPPDQGRSGADRRSLLVALVLVTGSLVVEVGGAVLSGSLALLADAADMVTNLTAISLALLSLWVASRPPTVVRTFGLLRTEVLVGMINAHVLVDPSHHDDDYALRRRLTEIARSNGDISHVTIQLEPSAAVCTENHHVDHLRARARLPRTRRLPFLG